MIALFEILTKNAESLQGKKNMYLAACLFKSKEFGLSLLIFIFIFILFSFAVSHPSSRVTVASQSFQESPPVALHQLVLSFP